VGVAPQYCGVLGKQANGQVVVTTRYVDPYYAWPVNGRLYLPEGWFADAERRQRADIPAQQTFQTKPAIALQLVDEARAMGVPFGIVVSDSSYGDNAAFLDGLAERNVHCVVSVASDFGVRLPQEVLTAARQPLPPKKKPGAPRKHPHPVQLAPLRRADAVIAAQGEPAWRTITWRMGDDGPLQKQFVARRVRRAVGEATGPEGWLLGERPLPGHEGERKFYWSDLPATTPLARLVEVAHRRPSVERGYQDGKSHTGMDDYAARKWSSFHRNLTIDMLVLSWLALQRPPLENPVVTVEPQPVESPDEPVFPLRPGTVSKHRDHSAGRLSVPGDRVDPLAGPHRPNRRLGATRSSAIPVPG
jgi:SRSO17 transposase